MGNLRIKKKPSKNESISLIFIEISLVRQEGLETTTFGSGGQRYNHNRELLLVRLSPLRTIHIVEPLSDSRAPLLNPKVQIYLSESIVIISHFLDNPNNPLTRQLIFSIFPDILGTTFQARAMNKKCTRFCTLVVYIINNNRYLEKNIAGLTYQRSLVRIQYRPLVILFLT